MSDISDHDDSHAQKVWNGFDMKKLGEYYDPYLKTDVILLSNIFEAFRNICLNHHSLDPAHFYTSPGLAWQSCLKYTDIWLELLTYPDMLLMFQRGIRGGITQAIHRYALANNKYMGVKFNHKEDSSFGGFNWVDLSEFMPDEIDSYANCDNEGYPLEVDVKYPKELHDSHNDLPFMREKMNINGVEKLVPNQYDNRNCIVHIKVLNQALRHGLVLEKVHHVIEFNQSAWLKPYIDFNTQFISQRKNDFDKDFLKLMNNSVFGKTMENIRKHKDIKLVTNRESYIKTAMKPNFKSGIYFIENLMGYEMGKAKVTMNKPVYLGQAVLDLSKLVMYDFHYDHIIPKYSENSKFCYMDTDFLVCHIKMEDF